ALTFCPVSAALFFGSLLPLAVSEKSAWLVPALFGFGSAAPVLAFAIRPRHLPRGGRTSVPATPVHAALDRPRERLAPRRDRCMDVPASDPAAFLAPRTHEL